MTDDILQQAVLIAEESNLSIKNMIEHFGGSYNTFIPDPRDVEVFVKLSNIDSNKTTTLAYHYDDNDIFDEIKSIVRDIVASVTQSALHKCRSVDLNVISEYNEWNEVEDIYSTTGSSGCFNKIIDGLNKASEMNMKWAIISPTHMTILRTMLSNWEKNNTGRTYKGGLLFVGNISGIDIYVDQYAHGDIAILLGTDGVINAGGYGIFYDSEPYIRPDTFEKALMFYDTHVFAVNSTKLATINVILKRLACFL